MILSSRDRGTARAALLLTLVLVAGWGAVYFRPAGGEVATWWPAAGFASALLLLGQRRLWGWYALGIVVASALANLIGGRGLEISVLFGMANAAEAVVVAAVLRRPGVPRPELASPEDFFLLVRACALGAATIAGGAALAVTITGGSWSVAARTTFPSHLASMLVILPLLLMTPSAGAARHRVAELGIQGACVAATALIVFSPHQELALVFLPLPFLIWAALRFGPYVAAVEVVGLAVVTTLATARGGGPFSVGVRSLAVDDMVAGVQVQVYLASAALMTLTTALAAAQRASLLRGLTNERELTTSMLEATAAIIIVADRDGSVLRVNPAMSRLAGFSAEHLLGRPIWEVELIPPERTGLVRQMFDPERGPTVPVTREADILTADGERRRVVWNNNIVRDESGHVAHVVFTGTDVTRERTTTGMLGHLLEAPMATILVGLDWQGRINVFNRGAEEMLGHSTAQMLGRRIEEVVTSGQPREYLRRDPGLVVERGRLPREMVDLAETTDWTWVTVSGSERTVSTTISVVTDVVGETLGYLCVGRDVTEQRRTQEMLVDALEKERHGMERLRRLDAAKDEFVSTVSHELRTPTTSIVGYTEMLLDGAAGDPTPEQLPMLEAIARNGERLIAVASDLLMLSELANDSDVEWERSPVDLAAIVAHSEEAIRPLLARRDLSVQFAVPDPVTVIGDAAHLDRVLMNLLSNAVKFTPDGGKISCKLEACGSYASLEVSDTGIGIPEDEQGDLFTKFFRSSNAQEKAIQGTGLGLSIISSIVAAHGGDIEVRSRQGHGTTFTVKLPMAQKPARLPLTRG